MSKANDLLGLIGKGKVKEGITDDTVLLPDVIADTVIRQVVGYLEKSGDEKTSHEVFDKLDHYTELLSQRAETMYEIPRWNKVFNSKGNKGRDTLYSFMQHWISAQVLRDFGIKLPQSFASGGVPLK